jgi:hypothetical protein
MSTCKWNLRQKPINTGFSSTLSSMAIVPNYLEKRRFQRFWKLKFQQSLVFGSSLTHQGTIQCYNTKGMSPSKILFSTLLSQPSKFRLKKRRKQKSNCDFPLSCTSTKKPKQSFSRRAQAFGANWALTKARSRIRRRSWRTNPRIGSTRSSKPLLQLPSRKELLEKYQESN